ncbi:MAG: hypothetical protein HY282_08535 [Nitrospirae bacterium]|nr:hypothetical protein [Candidatus Manganitrophaceae bacterium]
MDRLDRNEESDRLIEALIQLLGEEEGHLKVVQQKLIEIGSPALPALLKCKNEGTPIISERAEKIIETIRLGEMDQEWRHYAAKEPCPLEEGVFLLARFADPKIDPRHYQAHLNRMADVLRDRIQALSSPAEILQAISHYLFSELGFSGNREDYYLPENSYIHTVLETKKGIPISLSTLMLLLGERLNLPLYGIGMPGHFLVQWSDAAHDIFIDPFNQGKMMTRQEIASQLSADEAKFVNRYLQKVSTRQLLARMIRNLIHVYTEAGEVDKGTWLGRFHERIRFS